MGYIKEYYIKEYHWQFIFIIDIMKLILI